jgi:hypothetical protein
VNVKRIPYSRSSTMEHLGQMSSTWIEDRNPLESNVDPLEDDDNAKQFNVSLGWFL